MKYYAYDTFIDYLFSDSSKSLTYGDLECILTSAGNYDTFKPAEDGDGSITRSSVESSFVPSSAFRYPSARMDCRPWVSDSNSLDCETDKTYEEIFNIPASASLDLGSSYINKFVEKAKLNARLLGREVPSTSAEILGTEIPFKSVYDEVEYDSYGVPMTFLNGDAPGVKAENIVTSGDRISLASGFLIAVNKNENLYPIGFIDFETMIPSTRYEVKFDPQGFLQLK